MILSLSGRVWTCGTEVSKMGISWLEWGYYEDLNVGML
jgi:hypothetical protein